MKDKLDEIIANKYESDEDEDDITGEAMKYISYESMDTEETKQLMENKDGNIDSKEDNQEESNEINSNAEEEYQKAIENNLKSYYEGFFDMNNPKYNTFKTTVQEDIVTL